MKIEEIKKILSPICFKSKDCAYWKVQTKFPRRCKECEQKATQLQALFEKEKREMWEEIICPMCYRLNPHHATENDGKGCNWCQEKEDWCGQTMKQALEALKGGK